MSKTMNRNDNQNPSNARPAGGPAEEGMKINGLEQVVEMLKHADPAFRESLLKRLGQRDPQLAYNLRRIFR